MTFAANVLADSINQRGIRLTTFEATYPRIIHSEQMTHRVQSRNSASTRAIPLSSHVHNLLVNPFVPAKFGINQPGMQAYKHLVGLKHDQAVAIWLAGRDRALTTSLELILGHDIMRQLFWYDPATQHVSGEVLLDKFDDIKRLLPKSTDLDLAETSSLNVHKQLAGRGLEAYMWHTIIVTATEWDNYFGLRDHAAAQGEIATIARLIRREYQASQPRLLGEGEWHLPLVDEGEFAAVEDAIKASAARCAAVSYNRQAAKNPAKEFERYDDLRTGGHMSPLEHQATPFGALELAARQHMKEVALRYDTLGLDALTIQQLVVGTQFNGNLRGWTQHRKQVVHEDNFSDVIQEGN